MKNTYSKNNCNKEKFDKFKDKEHKNTIFKRNINSIVLLNIIIIIISLSLSIEQRYNVRNLNSDSIIKIIIKKTGQ
jgi:hypothetical protein